MGPVIRLVRESQRINLRAARHSQALVIACVSRLAGTATPPRTTLIGRATRLQLDLAAIAVGDPVQFVDSLYVHAEKLMALHREFADRLFEAIGTDERAHGSRGTATNVIPLLARRGTGH